MLRHCGLQGTDRLIQVSRKAKKNNFLKKRTKKVNSGETKQLEMMRENNNVRAGYCDCIVKSQAPSVFQE